MILQGTAVRTQQRMTLIVKSPISSRKAEYEGCATWSIPRGVSSHHVLRRAFGDAYYRREKVRHATFYFLNECVRIRVFRDLKHYNNLKKEKTWCAKQSSAELTE